MLNSVNIINIESESYLNMRKGHWLICKEWTSNIHLYKQQPNTKKKLLFRCLVDGEGEVLLFYFIYFFFFSRKFSDPSEFIKTTTSIN